MIQNGYKGYMVFWQRPGVLGASLLQPARSFFLSGPWEHPIIGGTFFLPIQSLVAGAFSPLFEVAIRLVFEIEVY